MACCADRTSSAVRRAGVFCSSTAVTVTMTAETTAMREGVCVPSESCSVLEISVCLQRECVTDTETVRPASMSSSVLSKVSMQNTIRFAFLKSNVL